MPTMPITAMFVLASNNTKYIIFQYADQSRSKPEELTAEKVQQLMNSLTGFNNAELQAYILASGTNLGMWVNVS